MRDFSKSLMVGNILKNGVYVSQFGDIKNLTGHISKEDKYFESKKRTALYHLEGKKKAILEDINSGKYEKLPATKSQMKILINYIDDEIKQLKSL